MEPCPNKPGVIFNPGETPKVIDELRAYVANRDIIHTPCARAVLEEVSGTYSVSHGFSGGVFLPEDEAMAISGLMRDNAEKSLPTLVYLGALGMQIALKSPYANTERRMANQIERTVKKSRKLFYRYL